MEQQGRFCYHHTLEMSSEMTQQQCQQLCVARDDCIGIVISHRDAANMEYCYMCHSETNSDTGNGFDFYRRCDVVEAGNHFTKIEDRKLLFDHHPRGRRLFEK